jgi:hypothetical protein
VVPERNSAPPRGESAVGAISERAAGASRLLLVHPDRPHLLVGVGACYCQDPPENGVFLLHERARDRLLLPPGKFVERLSVRGFGRLILCDQALDTRNTSEDCGTVMITDTG